MYIHPTACVEEGAELGADVRLGPFAFIAAGARVGPECEIGPHAVIYGSVTLGPRCRVHSGAVLGDTPQDLAFEGVASGVRIGADCVLREGVTVHRGTKEGTVTEVGDRCYLMANSHLGHNVRLGTRVILANGALLGGYVEVGDGAFISGNVVVHQFVRVGRLAMLGGGGAITQDVPPFCTTRTCGLNTIAGLNTVGLRRAGLDAAARSEIKQAFRLLYRAGLNTREALDRIRACHADGPARELADFVAGTQRGICSM